MLFKQTMNWIILLLLAVFSSTFAREDDHSHVILRVQPRSIEHMDALRNLDAHMGYDIDYLRSVRALDRPGDIIMTTPRLNKTKEYLDRHNVPNWILEDNLIVHRDKRAVLENVDPTTEMTKDLITNNYLNFDSQMRVMKQLATSNPNVVKLMKLGNSTEGRPIMAAKIGYKTNATKPILWIDAGIHAREWIAPSSGLYALWELVTNPTHTNLLRRIDVIIVPNANPDGYEYSRITNRLWRKTRSRIPMTMCKGVDGNRNYPFHWGEEGVSFNPCSEIYCGLGIRSEPEVQALVAKITELKNSIKGYIALHSYGEDILYPWGHVANAYPDDVEDLKVAANEMASAIKKISGTDYKVANSAGGLYPASGASDDWAKSVGIKYSYTIELSPNDAYFGFELPERFILKVVQEAFAGIESLAYYVAREPVHRGINRRFRG